MIDDLFSQIMLPETVDERGDGFLSLWIPRVPRKMWSARVAILTAENLRKRSVTYVTWCYMCKCSSGIVDHLLLHCKVVSSLWRVALNCFEIQWVIPGKIRDVLHSCTFEMRKRISRAWRLRL